jgi:hypothetical protein
MLKTTREAMKSIEDPDLRRDFLNLADGVEYAVESKDDELASKIMAALRTTAFILHRTISTAVAHKVLDASYYDAKSLELRPGWGAIENDKACERGGSCNDSPGSECDKLDYGCRTVGSDFHFRWPSEI